MDRIFTDVCFQSNPASYYIYVFCGNIYSRATPNLFPFWTVWVPEVVWSCVLSVGYPYEKHTQIKSQPEWRPPPDGRKENGEKNRNMEIDRWKRQRNCHNGRLVFVGTCNMWDGKWLDRPKGNVPHSTVSDKAAASELKKAGQVSPSSRPASPSARARPLTIRELIVLAGCVAELVTGWLEWGRRAGGGRQKNYTHAKALRSRQPAPCSGPAASRLVIFAVSATGVRRRHCPFEPPSLFVEHARVSTLSNNFVLIALVLRSSPIRFTPYTDWLAIN